VSVSAVATVSNTVPVLTVLAEPGTAVTVPTTNPALVIVVLAVALAVPSSYRWLSVFSFFSLTAVFCCHYAAKSPNATQVSVALLISVAEDHCARNLRPGVALIVTPAPAVKVHCPAPV